MSRDFGGRFPLRPNSLLKVHEGRERSHSNTGLLSVLSNDTHGNEVAGVFSDAFRATNNDEKCEPLQPTFYCFICLNNVKASQGYSLRNCGHSFCRKCLGRYLHSQFKSRQTHPRCFHITESKGACNMEIHPDDIKAASTEEAWKQYIYFSNKENNENYIDCPKCKTQQLGDPLQPWTECKNHGCGHQFCFVHQNQHAKEVLCADYEAQVRMEEKKTSAWRASNTKKCPKCGVSTEKNEGCNHMTCYICKTGWCWLCGEVIGKQVLPQHYREGKCKGKQFTEQNVPYMAAWEAAFCIMVPALFLLLLSPIAFVMALVACLLSPLLYSFVCCFDITDERNSMIQRTCANVMNCCIFGPLLLVTFPFWFPCFLYYRITISPRRHRMMAEQQMIQLAQQASIEANEAESGLRDHSQGLEEQPA